MNPKMYRAFGEIEDTHWWFVGRRRIIKQILSSLELSSRPRILDVGCGTGGTLSLLAEFGNVTGVEMEESAISRALARQVGEIRKGGLPDNLPFSTESFDVITLLDVLEHIDDDHSSLGALRALLAPGGYIILTVPAFPFLWSQHDIDNHHKRRYLASTLTNVIERAGLNIEHLTYYNMWFFPLAAAMRFMKKFIPSKEIGSDLLLPGKFINRMFQSIFGSERHFVTWASMPFGLSLVAIARRV